MLIFQSVRELLINVVKHANASRVDINVQYADGSLVTSVVDDSAGFSDASFEAFPSDSGGFGLFHLKDRLRLLGGSLRVESRDGTRVYLMMPVDGNE